MENPFYITGIIPEQYFCDRQQETQRLVKTLRNKAHILLMSKRRMGKTQLIYHVYNQPDIKGAYYTFYVDIFPTTSLHEMVLMLSKEIYSVLVPKGKVVLDYFLSTIKSLSGCFRYDPLTGTPSFDIKLGDIHSPELTLQEIFTYLETAEKPCIFAIDEFQQIARYPEKNTEALLRSHIQRMNNTCFIYAGSERHILENMFNSAAKPFYNSAESFYLDRIQKESYIRFALDQFTRNGLYVAEDAVEYAYNLFDGHTFYVHNLLHNTFANATPERTIGCDDIKTILSTTLEEKSHFFAGVLNQLNYQQKEVIIAIAKEKQATGVTSVAFVKKHALKSPSSVQFAISSLLEKQLISYESEGRNKTYFVSDQFLREWLRLTY